MDPLDRLGAWLEGHPLAEKVALMVACLLLGLVIGRGTAPRGEERTREKEETREASREDVKKFAINAQQTTVAKASSGGERIHRVVIRERCPQGAGTITRMTEDRTSGFRAAENAQQTQAAAEARVEYRDRVVEKTVEREATKAAVRPDWRFGVLAGVRAPDLLSGAPGGFPWLLGAQVERRILGPISVGAWGLSSGSAGASVGVDW